MSPAASPADPGHFARHGSRRRRVGRCLAVGVAAASALTLIVAGSPSTPVANAQTTPRVTLTMLPTQRVVPGATAQYPFTLRTAGNTGTVSFEATGLPAGATAEVVNLGSGRYELDIKIAANAPVSNSTITLRARSRAKLQTTTVYLQVLPAPQVQPPVTSPPVTSPPATLPPAPAPTTTQPAAAAPVFGLRSDNPERVVAAGQTASFGFTVDRASGFGGAVTFTAAGLPAGVSGNFAPNPTTTNSVLYLTPAATVPDGRYTFTITGTAGATVRVVTAILTVQNQADFALDVPASAVAPAGAVTNVVIGYRSLSATSSPATTLSVAGLPTGSAAYFSPNPATGSTTLVLSLAPGTPAGTYPLTITGTAGTITHSYPLSLIVSGAAGFGISALPATLSIARGTAGNVVVTVTPTGGFTGTVTMGVAGLPAGVGVTQVPGTNQVTLTFSVPVGTAAGVFPLTITGTSGGLSAAVAVTLTIT